MGENEESQRTVNVVFEDGGFVDGREVTIIKKLLEFERRYRFD